jgi:PAS domain S-box-containing protein
LSVPEIETSDVPDGPPSARAPDHAPGADGGGREAVDYRTLIEQIPAITYTEVHGGAGQRTTYVSPQATHILGYAPQEFIQDHQLWRRLRHPGDRAAVTAAERTADVTKQPFRAEYRMRDRAGREHWFRDDAVLLEKTGGGGTFWQGVMFDITAEKEAEHQARGAELRYRSLVESLPCMVYIDQLDERATNVYTSPQTSSIFGYTQQDWADDPDLWLGKMVHPEDRDRCRLAEAHHAETQEPFDETYRILHRDGRILWVRDVAVVVEDEQGIPLYSQGFLLDITSQKEVESDLKDALEREHAQADRLRSADELKNTLLHTLSHDLKGPITAVLAATSALKRPDVTEIERAELLDGMAVRARRMDRLLGDLLDLERLSRGVLQTNRLPLDVGRLVRDLVAESDMLDGRVVDVDAPRVIAPVDQPKVERAIDNLLVNAVRHTPPGTRIWVRVLPLDGGVLVCVDDEGTGVADELKAPIFEPFRKGQAGTPGSGIGLSLVARFAEFHGGRAWVEDREGGGAAFRVFLPGPDGDQPGPDGDHGAGSPEDSESSSPTGNGVGP